MRFLRQLLGRRPSSPNGRARNYVANQHLGAKHAVVHENIISLRREGLAARARGRGGDHRPGTIQARGSTPIELETSLLCRRMSDMRSTTQARCYYASSVSSAENRTRYSLSAKTEIVVEVFNSIEGL
jgi:hypothetical protein